MASIRAKDLDNGKRAFQVRWYAPDGREKSKQFAKRADAASFKSRIESELARGTYIDPTAGKVTVREFGEKWLANQMHYKASSARVIETVLRLHIYPHIGDMAISAVRRSDIQAMMTKWRRPAMRNNLRVTRTLFNAAVLDDVIVKTPARSIAMPAGVSADIVIPTIEQVREIAAATGSRFGSAVTIAASTGMRRAEILAMTLASVDLDARTIRIRPDLGQVVTATGERPRLGPPKTTAGARVLPMADVTARTIRDLIESNRPDPDDGFGGAFYVGRQRGGLVHPNILGDAVQPAMRAAGFGAQAGIHVMRHFYASALIAAGCSVKVVQARLGHSSATETLDLYGHLWPDDDDATREAIDAAFE